MAAVQRLRISPGKRLLMLEDGSPFFWLGDTAWELFHKLDRDNAEMYLRNRAGLRFNVIQAVVLAELDGLATANPYGRRPLKTNTDGAYDPTLPDTDGDYHYWAHVDDIIDYAASLGLYIALLPTWGDKFNLKHGKGPVIFNESNAKTYGYWLGHRYKDRNNIIWVLGGDRQLSEYAHFAVIRGMAEGLIAGDGGRHLITFHPQGAHSSSHHLHSEAWLDFNMLQSGHGEPAISNYVKITEDYNKQPVKPVLDGEPCYEDIPIGFKEANGYFDDAAVRTAAYYAVFSGAFGHTYGHHSVWSMTEEPDGFFILSWKEALSRPGAAQMQHLRSLMESRAFFDRVPDQGLVAINRPGANYIAATRGNDYALLYIPNGLPVQVNMGILPGERVKASWFDPRTGLYSNAVFLPNKGTLTFRPPSSGRGNDWVLVLDALRWSAQNGTNGCNGGYRNDSCNGLGSGLERQCK